MNIYEGTIITCDSKDSVAKYLVEDNGKVVFIGNALPVKFSQEKRINLEKKAIVPSFCSPFYLISDKSQTNNSEVFQSSQIDFPEIIKNKTKDGFLFFGLDFDDEKTFSFFKKKFETEFLDQNFLKFYSPSEQKLKKTFFSKENSSNLYEIRLDISAEHLTQLSSNAKNVLIRTKTNEQIEKVLKIISTTNFENQDKIITILFESEIDENLIKLCKKLDINLCLNVKKDFKSNILPLGKIVRSDVKLSFNFEESINPFEFISFYACATNPDAKLSVYELLRSLSFYGYEQCNEEKKYGSLENGKIANMLILSNSPYSVSKDKISTLKIEEIYSNGQHFELKRNSKFDKIKKIVYNKTKS